MERIDMSTKTRKAKFERKSSETVIKGELNVDGKGITKIKTPIGLLSHMLDLYCFHGYFDLSLDVKGDTHIDIHHTNEDIGIALGKAFKESLKDKKGIRRFGSAFAPMESTLGQTIIDISGRGYFSLNFTAEYPLLLTKEGEKVIQITNESQLRSVVLAKVQDNYTIKYLEHFLESFAHHLGATIKVIISYPTADLHTNIETVFKSLGMALDQATQIDPRRKGIPSTKGIID